MPQRIIGHFRTLSLEPPSLCPPAAMRHGGALRQAGLLVLLLACLCLSSCFDEEQAVEVRQRFEPRVDIGQAASIAFVPFPGGESGSRLTQALIQATSLHALETDEVRHALVEPDLLALSPAFARRLLQRLDTDIAVYGRILELEVTPHVNQSERRLPILGGLGVDLWTVYDRSVDLTLEVELHVVDARQGRELAALRLAGSGREPAGKVRRPGGPKDAAAVEHLFGDVDTNAAISHGMQRVANELQRHFEPQEFHNAVIFYTDAKEKHARNALTAARRAAWEDAAEMYGEVEQRGNKLSHEVRGRAYYNQSLALLFAKHFDASQAALSKAREHAASRRLVELVTEQQRRLDEFSGVASRL